MKIGILQPAGLAADIVSKAFSPQEVQELYKPVIYSKENQNDKNVSADLRAGNIDAIAVAPGSSFSVPQAMVMSVTSKVRIATALSGESLQDVYQKITLPLIKEKLQLLHKTLRRDFSCTAPRIALLALNTAPDAAEKDILEPAVRESVMEGMSVHGPYLIDSFINEQKYVHFDAIMAITDQQQETLLNAATDEMSINIILGMPYIITTCDATLPEPHDDLDLEPFIDQMRRAFYLSKDCTRNRRMFDRANASPLPKLYHERREDGEKVRFSVKKPPFMKSKSETPEETTPTE